VDRIDIKDLLIRGIIGMNAWEREVKQDILINLSLFCDLRQAGEADQLRKSPNYRNVTKEIVSHVEGSERHTVEALAADIAKICLKHAAVKRVRVRVEKPAALRFAKSVGVEIEREAGDFKRAK